MVAAKMFTGSGCSRFFCVSQLSPRALRRDTNVEARFAFNAQLPHSYIPAPPPQAAPVRR